mmetsp:Transcript_13330/g.22137  ORF Transcript_13330/g.22137 Transcript_13330/m.22137 type:complete len:274 (-) Transcript_13330:155-976(-)|eukprot:CAMPEP_0119306548 /NCGR_PEP_ID=MMETSP1333-20130426/7276_1 /TAXON_ID=418940 /ORGANISM="Scyphosphaera apsteinii, Strain RCC1455" /LENGTH=273 /DNA_ID=CAMNT_0007309867 /DNA_START=133 /DNA_END=954 /DNA_ORIENTATION=-
MRFGRLKLVSTAVVISTTSKVFRARALHLESSACLLPHIEKAISGGEDAFFCRENEFGVFDGVGGWADSGVDSGLFARNLAKETAAALERQPAADLVIALQQGLSAVQEVGTSTACLVRISAEGQLTALNVGDSGFRLLRHDDQGKLFIALRSEEQTHYFNCPWQLGTGSTDLPEHGDKLEGSVIAGDVLVLATDGCFDNLFDSELIALIQQSQGASASHLATTLAYAARETSLHPAHRTPFAASSALAGYDFPGGKPDDITVLVTIARSQKQ